MLVSVLYHDEGPGDQGADRDRDPAEAHDVRTDAQRLHGGERHQDPNRQHHDGNESAAYMQQEHDADERNDDALFRERSLQRFDRVVNQIRPVIDWNDLDALRQRRRHIGEARLHIVDDVKCILAETLQRNPAGDLPLPVKLGDATALIRSKFNPRHILEQDRRTLLHFQHNVREIRDAFDVPPAPHDEFELRELDGPPAYIHVAAADYIANFRKRDNDLKRFGSTMILYCLTKPPTLATSATPS